MTALLVSVRSVEEARSALAAGAKFIDAKDPANGALGALAPEIVREIVAAVEGKATVTAAAGNTIDIPAAEALIAAGADIVKIPVPRGRKAADSLSAAAKALAGRTRLVAVFAADRDPDLSFAGRAKADGFHGVMLDTEGKEKGLLQALPLGEIARFAGTAHGLGLMVGLAGSLKVTDVGTLAPFNPDVLGFRGGVCEDGLRTRPLDPTRVRAVATAIAVHGVRRAAGF